MSHATRLLFAYLGVTLIWATTPLAIQWGTLDTSFDFAAMSRMVIGMCCALLLIGLMRVPLPRHRRALASYTVAGLGQFLAMYGVYWAAQRIDSGLMSVIFGLSPLVTSLMASLWLGEKLLNLPRLLGMLLGLVGLGVIFGDGALLLEPGMLPGITVLLLGVLLHAASLVGLKYIADDSPPLATTTGALLVATPLFLLAWWLGGGTWPATYSWRGGLSILYLGVFGSVLGFALYYFIVRHMASERVALILVITPIAALFVGWQFNDEALPATAWIGGALISGGLLLHVRGSRAGRLEGRGRGLSKPPLARPHS
ncbi:DMT family transporter [Stutzerimonas tarimensis]|uniref:DMT family transporter n=1 Tax=Stutzerimonas tarimensis TaxID=1507735 RepID=A0ABV7T8B8_9GAMM